MKEFGAKLIFAKMKALGRIWYLIVSIPYHCFPPYFDIFNEVSGVIFLNRLSQPNVTLYSLSYQRLQIANLKRSLAQILLKTKVCWL